MDTPRTPRQSVSVEDLTERELDVLRLKAQNRSNQEIADELVLALSTVKWYVRQIYGKLGVVNRRQAVARAQVLGLVEGPPSPGIRPRHNLPAQTTPFIGRDQEQADLDALLADPEVRLVTILAPGGMGKTRLALATAESHLDRFADGVYMVPLAPLREPDQIVTAIAEATHFPFMSDERSPKQQVLDFLRHKHMLLLLDNFEHLLDGAGLVSEILQAAPAIQIVVTTRERLTLSGETVYSIGGMLFPDWETPEDALQYDAVRLFMQRTEQVCPGFELHPDELRFLACICRLVEGMPLGIVLAAAWTEVLSLEEIADEIQGSFGFLAAEMRDVPRRQWSIRAVFEPTWNRLTDSEQEAFMRFSVFRGGCTRDAAQAVTRADLRTLQALINKALLDRNSAGRYQMHELLRQYAEQQLKTADEIDTIRDAHCIHYIRFLCEREADLDGGNQLAALADLDQELENIHAAWSWALTTENYANLSQAVHILERYYAMRGMLVAGVTLFDQTVTALRDHPANRARDDLLGRILVHLAELRLRLFQYEQSTQLLNEAQPLIDAQGDQRIKALFCFLQGWPAIWRPFRDVGLDVTLARQHFEHALNLYREIDYRPGIALVLHWIGNSYWFPEKGQAARAQELSRAQHYLVEARTIQEDIGDIFGLSHTLMNLGNVASTAGQLDEGGALLLKSLALREQIGNRVQIAHTLHNLGVHEHKRGNYVEADQFLQRSMTHYRDMGVISHAAWELSSLGTSAMEASDFETARKLFSEGLTLVEDTEHNHIVADLRFGLAWTNWAQGEYDEAEKLAEQIQQASSALDPSYTMRALFLKGSIALVRCTYDQARELLEASWQIGQELSNRQVVTECRVGIALCLFQQGHIEQARQHVQASLDFYNSDAAHIISSPMLHKRLTADALCLLGAIDCARGDRAAARAHLHKSLSLARDAVHIAALMGVIATIAADYFVQTHQERSVELGAFVQHDHRSYAIDRAQATELLTNLASILPADVYAEAVERGAALDLETVVTELLKEFAE